MENNHISDTSDIGNSTSEERQTILQSLYETHHSKDGDKLELVKKAISHGVSNNQIFHCLDCKIRVMQRYFSYELSNIVFIIYITGNDYTVQLFNIDDGLSLLPKKTFQSKDYESVLKIYIDKFINHFR